MMFIPSKEFGVTNNITLYRSILRMEFDTPLGVGVGAGGRGAAMERGGLMSTCYKLTHHPEGR